MSAACRWFRSELSVVATPDYLKGTFFVEQIVALHVHTNCSLTWVACVDNGNAIFTWFQVKVGARNVMPQPLRVVCWAGSSVMMLVRVDVGCRRWERCKRPMNSRTLKFVSCCSIWIRRIRLSINCYTVHEQLSSSELVLHLSAWITFDLNRDLMLTQQRWYCVHCSMLIDRFICCRISSVGCSCAEAVNY